LSLSMDNLVMLIWLLLIVAVDRRGGGGALS
jgi:hypothetical protein